VTLESRRRSYGRGSLDRSDVDSDPIAQLREWLEAAEASENIEPNAMCIATVGRDGSPSARMVLLRGLDARGLRFYTSYFSRKGSELRENPRIAATFYWPELERQVRVEGDVRELSEEASDAYFATRPRGSQLSAWASEQSERIEERALLEERRAHFEERFEGEAVPRPHSWGGYVIAPSRVEFWQGRENRLHDRIVYERTAQDRWNIVRLQP
jgi:pyridoxamine 5'-phosphate oxidase